MILAILSIFLAIIESIFFGIVAGIMYRRKFKRKKED